MDYGVRKKSQDLLPLSPSFSLCKENIMAYPGSFRETEKRSIAIVRGHRDSVFQTPNSAADAEKRLSD